MARRACDGDGLLGAFRAAVMNLEAHVDEINALNVYPVPDGDTGSNMLATVKAALAEAEAAAGRPAERIASAISFGALMGARGNSGVITSQIFRGMAEGLGGKRRFNGLDLAHAMSQGARTAYGAVAKPVEGTILTVIRESADAAVAAAEHDNDIETVLAATVDAAEKSVARTPSLLAILREAGVVDSGGQGLYRLFQGALLHMVGKTPVSAARGRAQAGAGAKPSTLVAHADEGFGYETMFLLQPNGAGKSRPRRDPRPPRIDRRVRARRGGRAGAQGPRPQRASGPGRRLRTEPRARSAGSASRTSTTRPATSARRGRRRSPRMSASRERGPAPGPAPRARRATGDRLGPRMSRRSAS